MSETIKRWTNVRGSFGDDLHARVTELGPVVISPLVAIDDYNSLATRFEQQAEEIERAEKARELLDGLLAFANKEIERLKVTAEVVRVFNTPDPTVVDGVHRFVTGIIEQRKELATLKAKRAGNAWAWKWPDGSIDMAVTDGKPYGWGVTGPNEPPRNSPSFAEPGRWVRTCVHVEEPADE